LLAELKFEVWIGDPAQIRAKQVRKQKNDRRDAEHMLKLMLENHFPQLWVPSFLLQVAIGQLGNPCLRQLSLIP
jgi:transposase